MSQDEDEWEYEYDREATETFLLDLDLTSLNGGLRSNIPGKRPLDRPEQMSKPKASNADVRLQSTPSNEHLAATSGSSVGLKDPFGPAPNSVQILDFTSGNPIVSYQNEVYSCTWSDVVGTNMFFTNPSSQWPEPEEPVEPVELLGMSRIRLIGHKAKTAVKQDNKVRGAARKDRPVKGGTSTSTIAYSNPAFKRQAEFLERLKDAKKVKGDTDVVRMVVPDLSNRGTPISAPPGTDVEGDSAPEDEHMAEEVDHNNKTRDMLSSSA